jgi:hypothetical protein
MDLEDCVKQITVKKINGDVWMLLKSKCYECYGCPNHDELKINYCKSRRVYFAYLKEKDGQLSLPFV